MSAILGLFRTEPTVVIGVIGGVVDALIVLGVVAVLIAQANVRELLFGAGVVIAGAVIVGLVPRKPRAQS